MPIPEKCRFKKRKEKKLIKTLIKNILKKININLIKTKRMFIPIIFFNPMIRKNKGNKHAAKENKSVITKPNPLNAKYSKDSEFKISK